MMTIVRRLIPWLGLLPACGLLLISTAVAADTTGGRNPSLNQGAFGKATNAYLDDTSVADADADQVHTYWGYSFNLPAQAVIEGIAVRLDGELAGGAPAALAVELSWDGGTSWTATGYEQSFTAGMGTYVLGGLEDAWGRTWVASELESANFRVRLSVVTNANGKVIKLHWVPVTIYYQHLSQEVVLQPVGIDFESIGLSDVDMGYKEVAQTLYITSTTDWTVTVRGTSSTWTYGGSEADPLKPVGDLEWAAASSAPEVTSVATLFAGLTTLENQVAAGTSGTDIVVQMALRMLLSYDLDPPGDYSISLAYTITAP